MSVLHLPQSGLSIACTDTGSGPVLFFVHGVSESRVIWRDVVALLAPHYRCISIDLPGHGESVKQRGSFQLSFYSSILLECMEALRLSDVIYCGHSMGGQIGIITALRAPSRFSRLVLVNSAGFEVFTPAEKQALQAWTEKTYSDPDYTAQLRKTLTAHFFSQPMRGEELLREHERQNAGQTFGSWSRMIIASVNSMLDEPVYDFLPLLQVPVSLLYGNLDLVIPNRIIHPQLNTDLVYKQGAARIPDASLHVLPGCGHYAPFEQPELFARILQKAVKG